jgi:hypothetical protein
MQRRLLCLLTVALPLLLSANASGQLPIAVDQYGESQGFAPSFFDGGSGVQLYPYDQQDPWLHGYFQRYPSYGGYNSFRPYNYKQVYSQARISNHWGSPAGMPYSQQFWNRYRTNYMDGMLHDTAPNPAAQPRGAQGDPFAAGIGGSVNPIGFRRAWNAPAPGTRLK